jgi:hypothetical protein
MNRREFGDEHSLRPWPLQGVQHVGVFGVPALHTRVARDFAGSIPELEETDRGISPIVEVPDPGTDYPVARPVDSAKPSPGVTDYEVADQATSTRGQRSWRNCLASPLGCRESN